MGKLIPWPLYPSHALLLIHPSALRQCMAFSVGSERLPSGRLPSGRTPCPEISRKHAAGCKQQEVYWIRRYLGRHSLSKDLRACRLGVRGFYRGAKSKVYRSEMQGGKFLTLDNIEGTSQRFIVPLILPSPFLAGDQMSDSIAPDP